MGLYDIGVSTLGDARKFDSMYPSDMVIAGFSAHTCTVGSGGILKQIANLVHGINRETQVAPILIHHICRRCEFAMRKNNKRHYLLRFAPMTYTNQGTHISGELDYNKEELATFCAQGMEQSIFSELPKQGYDNIPTILVPLTDCNGFIERKD